MNPNIITYVIIFIVVLLPSIASGMLFQSQDDEGLVKGGDSLRLPPLYRILHYLIKTVDSFGIGVLLSRIREEKTKYLEKKITIANLTLTPQIVFSAQVLVMILGGGISALLFLATPLERQWSVLALVIGGWIGWIYPVVTVEDMADKRQTAIVRGMPFAIDLIGSAMRSGLDFGAAIRYYVSLGITTPLTVEFGIMLRQIELGKTRIEALTMMAQRIDSKEFTSFVGAVAHGTEVGASIVDTMNIQSEEMRRARFNLAERKAARAPSLMILPMALFIMPAVFIIIFTPVYLKVQASGMGGFFK